MSDARETLRRGIGDFVPQPDGYERVLQRRDRKRRNQRMMASSLAIVIVLIGVLAFVEALRSGSTPRDDGIGPTDVPSNGAVAFSAVYLDTVAPDHIPTRGTPRDIYLTAPGQDPRRIVGSGHDGIDQGCPRYSPDGMKLAYVEGGDNSPGSTVVVIELGDDAAPSGTPIQVIGDANGVLVGCPQWSPDGSRLAIVDVKHGIGIATLDDRPNPATSSSFISARPGVQQFAWSPDGSTLAVLDAAGTVRLVPVDGGEDRTLWVPAGQQISRTIAWSPDGRRLAIGGSVGFPNHCCVGHRPFLKLVDTVGGSVSALPTQGKASGDIVDDLTWLPGADRILVRYFESGSVLADPTGTAPTAVLDLDFMPASSLGVSPDGRSVLYVAFDGNSYAVTAESLDGSSAPVLYSPWTFGLYTNVGDLSWQPIYP